MNYQGALIAGIIFAGFGVIIGAFGAHALKNILDANERTDTFELAVRYQFYHAFALMVAGFLLQPKQNKFLSYAASCFATGIFFFSGSLYLLSFTDTSMFGAITPVGGILFIAGWILLLIGILRGFRTEN